MNCEICNGTGWAIVEIDGAEAARPCQCRKRAQATEKPGTPMNEKAAMQAADALEVLAFFPKAGTPARLMVGDALMSMCATVEQARWLVRRAIQLYRRWEECGLPGLRQILCSKHRPKDGMMISCTESYPDGIPSEQPERNRLLAAPDHKQLASGDAQIAEAIHETAEPKAIKPTSRGILGTRGQQFSQILEDTITPPADRKPVPGPAPQVITQADVDREVAKLRQQKAEAARQAGSTEEVA